MLNVILWKLFYVCKGTQKRLNNLHGSKCLQSKSRHWRLLPNEIQSYTKGIIDEKKLKTKYKYPNRVETIIKFK